MRSRLQYLPALYHYFGPGWLAFRLLYAARLRSGWLARQMPAYDWSQRPLETWLRPGVPAEAEDYVAFRAAQGGSFFVTGDFAAYDLSHFAPDQTLIQADAILAGEWPCFSIPGFAAGFPPDWHRNPQTGQTITAERHWSQIDDFEQGDIKLIWEANRFSPVYTLVRAYVASGDERYAAAFWQLVEDWAERNPPQRGPNWKCGQETTFRLMAWIFGFYGFARAVHSTPPRIARLAAMIAAQGERIAGNIAYAYSQKNNHGISEAVGLWTIGLLFPEFESSERWREAGQAGLTREMRRQFYADGSYVQHSMNYQRVALHDCLWALRLGEIKGQRLPDELYSLVDKALDFLYALIDLESGQLPNTGANDGALILPLNHCDYNDYRPLLQAGSYLLHRRRLFPPGPWDEDLLWLFGPQALDSQVVLKPQPAELAARAGGYYLLRGDHSHLMLRCADYHDRPAHADQLHVDLCWRGINIACDAGTNLYNGPPPWNNGLATSLVHNTVTADGQDQMTRAGLFLWLDWAVGRLIPSDSPDSWTAEHDGYIRLSPPVTHQRRVHRLPKDSWLVFDRLDSSGPHEYRLHWLLPDLPYTWDDGHLQLDTPAGPYHLYLRCSTSPKYEIIRADERSVRGWRSLTYAQKRPALSLTAEIQADQAWFATTFTSLPLSGGEFDSLLPLP